MIATPWLVNPEVPVVIPSAKFQVGVLTGLSAPLTVPAENMPLKLAVDEAVSLATPMYQLARVFAA